MMRTVLLLVCMVLGSTVELAGTLQMRCRARSEPALAVRVSSGMTGEACSLERGCTMTGSACTPRAARSEWRCGCCRTRGPVAIASLRIAPMPDALVWSAPAVSDPGWLRAEHAHGSYRAALEGPPPRG